MPRLCRDLRIFSGTKYGFLGTKNYSTPLFMLLKSLFWWQNNQNQEFCILGVLFGCKKCVPLLNLVFDLFWASCCYCMYCSHDSPRVSPQGHWVQFAFCRILSIYVTQQKYKGRVPRKKTRIFYGLLPNQGGGSARVVKKPYCFFEKVFFQRACRIILEPPKHVLHLVWSPFVIYTAIKTALKFINDGKQI